LVVQLETGLAWIGLSEDNLAEVYALGASYPNRVPTRDCLVTALIGFDGC